MNVRELPIGWGDRGNSSDPSLTLKSERPGDWREQDLASKYAKEASKYAKKDEEDKETKSRVPVGFLNRSNSATLEELSLSTSASEVAVAEVGLKGKSAMQPTGLSYVEPRIMNPMKQEQQASFHSQQPRVPISQPAVSVAIPEQASVPPAVQVAGGGGGDQMMTTLIQAVLKM